MSKLLAGVLTLSVIVVALAVYPSTGSTDSPLDYATTWFRDRWTGNQRSVFQDSTECSCLVLAARSSAPAA